MPVLKRSSLFYTSSLLYSDTPGVEDEAPVQSYDYTLPNCEAPPLPTLPSGSHYLVSLSTSVLICAVLNIHLLLTLNFLCAQIPGNSEGFTCFFLYFRGVCCSWCYRQLPGPGPQVGSGPRHRWRWQEGQSVGRRKTQLYYGRTHFQLSF